LKAFDQIPPGGALHETQLDELSLLQPLWVATPLFNTVAAAIEEKQKILDFLTAVKKCCVFFIKQQQDQEQLYPSKPHYDHNKCEAQTFFICKLKDKLKGQLQPFYSPNFAFKQPWEEKEHIGLAAQYQFASEYLLTVKRLAREHSPIICHRLIIP
jgi:hypothetical protein